MKTLYLDCGMGAAGDMLASALLELFPEPQDMVDRLNDIGVPDVRYTLEKAVKCGITGSRLHVHVHGNEEHEHHHEHEHEHEHHHDHEHEHHHDHDHEEHEHHHDHEGHEHHHHHNHEGHHHADEIFTSWGVETPKKFERADIDAALDSLEDADKYGMILRAKGMGASNDGTWIYFDYVPGEKNIRTGKADVTGKLCVIGSDLNEHEIEELFGV